MIVKNDLFDYKDRYIIQDNEGFKFSLDSILLAEYIQNIKKNEIIVDLCAGNMAVGLILSKYFDNNITGFEIQKEVFDMAVKSIEINNLNRLNVINDDVNNIGKYYPKKSIDIMVCNPPYFKLDKTSLLNKNNKLSIARHEIALNLENIFQIANSYLKDTGKLYMVHRANRLDEIIVIASKYNVNVKNIQLITTKEEMEPYIVLIKCVKNSKFGVKIAPEKCIQNLKTYQNIFKE